MGRPQEFDSDAVVDAALSVFWDRGLHRTSVDDLLNASGLARSSLYNTYGGKQSLFKQAVQRYVENQVVRLQKILGAPTLKQSLEKLFHSAIYDNYDGRGCLLVNCAGGVMREDAFEQELLRDGFKRMFALVEQRMQAAQDAKELSPSIDPADAATLVCATLSGLRVFHKSGLQKTKLRKSADLSINALLQQLE
jgi:TetR/AcrR family transcriptional repressor of nem operon